MYPLPNANLFVHLLEFKTEPCALQPQQAKTSFKIPKHKCAIYSHVKESFLQRLTFFFPFRKLDLFKLFTMLSIIAIINNDNDNH